ncbi:MAG: hypothetical protein ACREDR_15085 [Blastocatellia bacterium]
MLVYSGESLQLTLAATLYQGDNITSQLMPGFSCTLADIFQGIPANLPTSE